MIIMNYTGDPIEIKRKPIIYNIIAMIYYDIKIIFKKIRKLLHFPQKHTYPEGMISPATAFLVADILRTKNM